MPDPENKVSKDYPTKVMNPDPKEIYKNARGQSELVSRLSLFEDPPQKPPSKTSEEKSRSSRDRHQSRESSNATIRGENVSPARAPASSHRGSHRGSQHDPSKFKHFDTIFNGGLPESSTSSKRASHGSEHGMSHRDGQHDGSPMRSERPRHDSVTVTESDGRIHWVAGRGNEIIGGGGKRKGSHHTPSAPREDPEAEGVNRSAEKPLEVADPLKAMSISSPGGSHEPDSKQRPQNVRIYHPQHTAPRPNEASREAFRNYRKTFSPIPEDLPYARTRRWDAQDQPIHTRKIRHLYTVGILLPRDRAEEVLFDAEVSFDSAINPTGHITSTRKLSDYDRFISTNADMFDNSGTDWTWNPILDYADNWMIVHLLGKAAKHGVELWIRPVLLDSRNRITLCVINAKAARRMGQVTGGVDRGWAWSPVPPAMEHRGLPWIG